MSNYIFRFLDDPEELGLHIYIQRIYIVKKTVPLSAISSFPMLMLVAPVNATLLYPKISLSISTQKILLIFLSLPTIFSKGLYLYLKIVDGCYHNNFGVWICLIIYHHKLFFSSNKCFLFVIFVLIFKYTVLRIILRFCASYYGFAHHITVLRIILVLYL